jgi:hypothetical protein
VRAPSIWGWSPCAVTLAAVCFPSPTGCRHAAWQGRTRQRVPVYCAPAGAPGVLPRLRQSDEQQASWVCGTSGPRRRALSLPCTAARNRALVWPQKVLRRKPWIVGRLALDGALADVIGSALARDVAPGAVTPAVCAKLVPPPEGYMGVKTKLLNVAVLSSPSPSTATSR